MTDHLTVLTHSHALATKRHYVGPDGRRLTDDYGKGARFEALVVPIADFAGLAAVLSKLVDEPRTFVVRGEPVQDGEPAGLREVPRRWLMVDADQALTREDVGDLDLLRADHCEEGARRLLARMPPELRGVACFWQLSSNAGIKPGLRGHLWFWLDRPMGERELKRWAENVNDAAGRQLVDWHGVLTVQPLYIANPIFDVGAADPVAKRWGVLPGAPEASLPKNSQRADAYLRKLAALYNRANAETHPVLRDACASYFCSRGADADPADLLSAMRRAVDSAHARRGDGETLYTDERLLEYAESGRRFAADRGAAAENLARGGDGALKPTLENIRAVVVATPEWEGVLAKNTRSDTVECLAAPPFEEGYAGPPETCPRQWRDVDDQRLAIWLQRQHQLQVHTGLVREAVNVIATEAAHDPVRDALLAHAWDGVPRADTWLVDLCGVEDSRYSRKVGAMWLMQAVARAFDPGCKADGVLVLEGLQGKRKSSFLRDLAGGLEYFQEGVGDILSKDTWLAMQVAWIVELRENPGLSGREVEAYKMFIDRQNDRYRSPYGARPENHYRRCVMVATTNLQAYLHDDTGARRWWPVTCTTCDLDQLEDVRDQLWAEVVYRYLRRHETGETWWVEADDPDFVREQEARYDADSREDVLRQALNAGCQRQRFPNDPPHPVLPIEPNAQRVTVAQILYHHWLLVTRDQDKRSQMAVASMLRRLGWQRFNSGATKCWLRGGQDSVIGIPTALLKK